MGSKNTNNNIDAVPKAFKQNDGELKNYISYPVLPGNIKTVMHVQWPPVAVLLSRTHTLTHTIIAWNLYSHMCGLIDRPGLGRAELAHTHTYTQPRAHLRVRACFVWLKFLRQIIWIIYNNIFSERMAEWLRCHVIRNQFYFERSILCFMRAYNHFNQ